MLYKIVWFMLLKIFIYKQIITVVVGKNMAPKERGNITKCGLVVVGWPC